MDDSLELRKQNLKYYEAQEKGFSVPMQKFYADDVVSFNIFNAFSATC